MANVALWDERLQMMQVQVEPAAMQQRDVSLDQVMEATADAVDSGLLRFSSGSVIGTGGMVETPNQRLSVRNVLPIVTPADLAQVPVDAAATAAGGRRTAGGAGPPGRAGTGRRIGDVADVRRDQPAADRRRDHQRRARAAAGRREAALGQHRRDDPRASRTSSATLEPGLPGVHFDTTIFQQANFIELAIDNLTQALVLGFLLVVVILGLFLFEWRVALISLLTIPLSLMATLLVLHGLGQTVNTMILAGLVIALGAVVDDAIIDVENIVRRLRQHRRAGGSRASTGSVILEASLEVRSPIVFATLIIVAAAIPVFLLQGLTGAFFRPLALSYTLAIVASMVVAMTLTPALTLILLRNTPDRAARVAGRPRAAARLHRRCSRGWSAGPRWTYAGVARSSPRSGSSIVPTLGQSLFPHFKEPDFLIHWVTQPGTSDAEMERTTPEVSAGAAQDPRAAQLRGAHRPGVPGGGGRRRQPRRELGEHRPVGRLRRDAARPSRTSPTSTRACSARRRPTSTSGSRRSSAAARSRSSSASSGRTCTCSGRRPSEINHIMAGIHGTVDHHVDISTDVPQLAGRGRPRSGGPVRPQAR